MAGAHAGEHGFTLEIRGRTIESVLLFEFFPAVLAIIVAVVGVTLYAVNRRAQHETESPRSPSQPPVSPGSTPHPPGNNRRPSMRA
jgi:hypothetical protein